MSRTTSAAVKLVLAPGKDYDTDDNPDLAPFIDAASAIVDDVVSCATDRGVTISTARAELIERWLAAWAYCLSDQSEQNSSTEGASAGYQGQTGMHFEANKYGQMAVSLDPSGCLNAIGKQQRAQITWLGKSPSSQIDYADRD